MSVEPAEQVKEPLLSDSVEKASEIELLPDLFILLQQLESGELQSKDFENHSGPIRVKLGKLKQYLLSVDGICESVPDRQAKIQSIQESNERKESFLASFKDRVTQDLKDSS